MDEGFGGGGVAFLVDLGRERFEADDVAGWGGRFLVPEFGQLEGAKHDVGGVAAEVTDDSTAEGAPTAPGTRQIGGVVGAIFCGAEPSVPVECFRDGGGIGGAVEGCVTAIEPDVGFADFAEDAALGEFDGPAERGCGGALVSHLGDDPRFAGDEAHGPGFLDRAGEGFFAIDVFSLSHAGDGRDCVGVVGGGDQNGVDILAGGIEHAPEVLEHLGLGEGFEGVGSVGVVDVAEGDDVFATAVDIIDVASTLAGDADCGDVQFAIGVIGEGCPGFWKQEQAGAEGRGFQETTTGERGFHNLGWLDT